MNRFSLHSKDGWPKGVDPVIKKHLTWVNIVIHTTLVGVEAAGLYVLFIIPGGKQLFIGPFVGMCGIYQIWSILKQIGRDHNASAYEIVKHNIPR